MPATDSNAGLTGLGFSPLEASVYAFLLREGPTSGYRAAKALGKPVANTYHAVESLQAKGAAVIEDGGDTRICRALEPSEIFARMRRDFDQRCQAAEQSLSRLNRPTEDGRLYTLRTRAHVLARARQMLASCKCTAVFDIFPGLFNELKPDIRKAASRGVAVAALLYEPASVPRAITIVHARPKLALDIMPGEVLALATDAREYLIALTDPDGDEAHQALWTRSVFLSCLHHDGLVCQMLTQALDHALSGNMSMKDLARFRERLRRVTIFKTPGFEELRTQSSKVPRSAERARRPLTKGGRR